MEIQEENATVTLGISIPVDPSKQTTVPYFASQRHSTAICSDNTDEQVDSETDNISSRKAQFHFLPYSFDPNLGLVKKLSSSNIPYEESTFNSWNIEPYFLHILPLSVSSTLENSVLIFGGLDPSSLLKKRKIELEHEDFVLGSTIFQYAIDTGVWKYYGTMIEPRCYHACVLVGQYVYITGGYSLLKRDHGEMLAVSSTDRLNLTSRQWKRCANMISARAAHAIALHKTDIYVLGGRNSCGKLLASVEVYNPEQDIWAEISTLPQPTMGLSATCIKDHIWVIGGITAGSNDLPNCILSNVYSFSPSMQRWYSEVSLPYACAFSACTSNNSSLWLIGGSTFSKDSKEYTMVSCSLILQLSFSTRPQRWKMVASLLHPRHALTAILYGDNIYVFGGMESSLKSSSNVIEVVNINTCMSIESTNIPTFLCGCSSVLILQEELIYPKCLKCGKKFNQSSNGFVSYMGHTDNCLCNFRDNLINYANKFQVSSIQKDFTLDSIKHEAYIPEKSDSETDSSDQAMYVKTMGITNDSSCESTKVKEHIQLQDSIDRFRSTDFENCTLKNDEDQNILQYRASMEILLNSARPQNDVNLNFLDTEKSAATKWQKYFDTLTSSERLVCKKILETSEIKEGIENRNDLWYSKEANFGKSHELPRTSNNNILSKSWEKPKYSSQPNFISVPEDSNETHVDKSHELSRTSDNNMLSKSWEKPKHFSRPDFISTPEDRSLHNESFLYIQSNLASQQSNSGNLSNFDKSILTSSNSHPVSPFLQPTELNKDSLSIVFSGIERIPVTQDILPCILIMGGEYYFDTENGHCVLLYHCSKDFWEHAGNMPEYRCHHCAVLLKSRIYIIGGFDSKSSKEINDITSKTICYDFRKTIWLRKANMNVSRAYHSAIMFNEEIYAVGGRDKLGNILASVEAYNETKNEWRICRPLPYPILGAAVININNFIFVFGGITYEEDVEILSSNTSVFDLRTKSWSLGPELEIPLAFSGISSSLNSVWLYGGLTENESDIISIKDIFKFDISSFMWEKVAELSISRHASITASLGNNTYVIGGHSTQAQKEVTICEQIDILTNEVVIVKSLPIAVSGKAGAAIIEM